MVSSKRLIQMVRKWKRMAALGRKRILLATRTRSGHVFIYSADGRRFMIPITYLSSSIFAELFRLSEEEFGLPTDGPITLPCNALFMEHILSILRHPASMEIERAALLSISNCRSMASYLPPEELHKHQLVL